MKRYLLLSLLVIFSFVVNAQTNTWTGGASGNWTTSSNWSLGHDPTSSEDAVITANCTISVGSFPASGIRAIRSLKISGGVTVKLTCSANATRYLRMASTSTITKGLQIDAGNTLIFDATNASGTGTWTCDLTGAAGVTGQIDGVLQFEGSGSGAGAARLVVYNGAANNANLVVGSTGSIVHKNDTGDDVSAIGSYLAMQSGSVYEQQDAGGSVPDGNWNPGSTLKLTTTATTAPVFNGATYGNIDVNCTGLTNPLVFNKNISFNNVTLTSTGISWFTVRNTTGTIPYTITINGDLTVSSSSVVDLATGTSLGDSTGNIRVKGNITNNGTIRSNEGDEPNRFELGGTANQNISGTGAWFGNHLSIVIDNPAGATLQSPLLFKGRLVFGRGNLRTTSINILTMSRGAGYAATWSGASSASFVDGPMRNVSTNTWITFPIGKGTIYAPIGYYHILNHLVTDTFRAEYFRANPQTVYGNSYDGTGNPEVIHHISNVEYWSLTSTVTSGTFLTNSIEPHVTMNSFCLDMNNTFTARFDPLTNKWKNAGTIARNIDSPGPPFSIGYLQSVYSEAGIFTLATSSPNNILGTSETALPIHLITFDAQKINSTSSLVSWRLGDFSSAEEKFEIQRSGKEKDFATIGTVSGKESDHFYNYTDNDLKTGVNFYRLRMTDKDGKVTYSRTVAVINDVNTVLIASLVPTVVNDRATLIISASRAQKLDIIITDMQGRVMLRRNFNVAAGNTNIDLAMERLGAGMYLLTGTSSEGKLNTIRFIKQ